MGRASRRKRERRDTTEEQGPAPWSATVAARQATALLPAIETPHPAMLSVMMTAANQYIGDVKELLERGDPAAQALGLSTLSVGSGMPAEQWLGEIEQLGEDMRRVPDASPATHDRLMARMHRLLHQCKPYPPHTEVYVISPEMHNVVMAASMTVTAEDLFTVDPDTDPPTPAGVLLLPRACGGEGRVFAPISVIGWRPEPGQVLPSSSCKPGVWVEGWSLRRDIDQFLQWKLAVVASRKAVVASPVGIPFAHDWLFNGDGMTGTERETLIAGSTFNKSLQDSQLGDLAEYDPSDDTKFRLGAYSFAFWRLCGQHVSATARPDGRPVTTAHRRGSGAEVDERPVDRVRVVRLRTSSSAAAADGSAGERRYHHRWPVRMHKVRQFYPSQATHKVIWRGPYIKGPDGAPLLIGGKAQAIT